MTENPFESAARQYDNWYEQFPNTFQSELLALRSMLPHAGQWVEIGVGTGRFAAQLGISLGIDPSKAMSALASSRGIEVICGRAEALPLDPGSVDAVFFITTLCFVQDLHLALEEVQRVLRPGGHCIIGLLPLDSPLGEGMRAHADSDIFFRHARLHSTHDVCQALHVSGLVHQQAMQTLLGSPESFEARVQLPVPGHDRGSFVVIRATSEP